MFLERAIRVEPPFPTSNDMLTLPHERCEYEYRRQRVRVCRRLHSELAVLPPDDVYESQGCRGHADFHGDSRGHGYGMGMGTMMNPHGPVGILWGL